MDMLMGGGWQRALGELCERHDVPGAQVGVVGADGEVRVAVAGVTSRTTRVEVDADTLFQYGSITKVWTTTLLMQLVDEGEIALDTPVVDVLPGFRVADERYGDVITMAQLVTHTSGISGDLFSDTGDGDDCVERYVALLASAPSVTAPGGPLSYCNAGFVVAGRVVEVVRGKAWDDVLAERLLGPLGLTRVITRARDAPLFRVAVGHVRGDGAAVPASRWMLPRALGPAGLIAGSAGDLLRFAATHLRDGVGLNGERVLSAESARLMREPRVDLRGVSTVTSGWGLGWTLADWGRSGNPVPAVQHGGQTIGQNARLCAFPDSGVAFCVLTNSVSGPGFAEAVADMIGAELGLTPPRPLVEEGGDLTRALGVYETAASTCTLYRETDGRIFLDVASKLDPEGEPEPPMPVRPTGGGRFTVELNGAESEFCHVVHDGEDFLYMNRLFQRVKAG